MIGRDDIEAADAAVRPRWPSFRKALSLLWRQACDRLKYPRGTDS